MTPEQREVYNARARERYAANPEPKKARARAYRLANPEKARAAIKRWWDAHPERIKELNRQSVKRYAKDHPDRVAAGLAAWKRRNRKHVREYMAAWREANPEKVAAMHQRRRARRQGAEGCGFEPDLWVDVILIGWGNRCCYCSQPFTEERPATLDHVVPLARQGNHQPSNLVPCCFTCNCSKSDKLLSEWREGKHVSVVNHAAAIARALEL